MPWGWLGDCRVFGKILKVFHITNSTAPEPEGSSPHSQQPANGPCPEPGESTPHPPRPPQPISRISILFPSSHIRLCLPSGLFPSGFPTKTVYTFIPSPIQTKFSHGARNYACVNTDVSAVCCWETVLTFGHRGEPIIVYFRVSVPPGLPLTCSVWGACVFAVVRLSWCLGPLQHPDHLLSVFLPSLDTCGTSVRFQVLTSASWKCRQQAPLKRR
jgi:hypothetical protein